MIITRVRSKVWMNTHVPESYEIFTLWNIDQEVTILYELLKPPYSVSHGGRNFIAHQSIFKNKIYCTEQYLTGLI